MGRLLGLDYGKKRVGVAVTDEIQMLSSPYGVFSNDATLPKQLQQLAEKYHFEKVILGYPHSDQYQEAIEEVRKFATQVQEWLGLEVEFQNEEFSTVYATSFLRSIGVKDKDLKQQIDKYAAQKILADYLSKSTV